MSTMQKDSIVFLLYFCYCNIVFNYARGSAIVFAQERTGIMSDIIVTTGDLKQDYEVLGPVYFQVSNKGLFGSALDKFKKKYMSEIQDKKDKGSMSEDTQDWGFLYGEWSVGQNDFEAAFFIATEELKKRAKMVGADAVIGMRQDIDMDTNSFSFFYLQMYGTAVKLK